MLYLHISQIDNVRLIHSAYDESDIKNMPAEDLVGYTEVQPSKPADHTHYILTSPHPTRCNSNSWMKKVSKELTAQEAVNELVTAWDWDQGYAETVIANMSIGDYTVPDEPWAAAYRLTRTN